MKKDAEDLNCAKARGMSYRELNEGRCLGYGGCKVQKYFLCARKVKKRLCCENAPVVVGEERFRSCRISVVWGFYSVAEVLMLTYYSFFEIKPLGELRVFIAHLEAFEILSSALVSDIALCLRTCVEHVGVDLREWVQVEVEVKNFIFRHFAGSKRVWVLMKFFKNRV